jgi:hypothetical protein
LKLKDIKWGKPLKSIFGGILKGRKPKEAIRDYLGEVAQKNLSREEFLDELQKVRSYLDQAKLDEATTHLQAVRDTIFAYAPEKKRTLAGIDYILTMMQDKMRIERIQATLDVLISNTKGGQVD